MISGFCSSPLPGTIDKFVSFKTSCFKFRIFISSSNLTKMIKSTYSAALWWQHHLPRIEIDYKKGKKYSSYNKMFCPWKQIAVVTSDSKNMFFFYLYNDFVSGNLDCEWYPKCKNCRTNWLKKHDWIKEIDTSTNLLDLWPYIEQKKKSTNTHFNYNKPLDLPMAVVFCWQTANTFCDCPNTLNLVIKQQLLFD